MKNTKKKLFNQSIIVKTSFTGSNITRYSGLNTVAKYIHPVKLVSDLAKLFNGVNRQNIVKIFGKSFPTMWYNATKFGVNPVKSALQNRLFNRVNQILITITLSSISGIRRICKIAAFSGDGLVKALLKLDKAINENAISATLKNLGQSSARKLQMLLLSKNAR